MPRSRSRDCSPNRRAASISDGRFAKLDDLVKHYDATMSLALTAEEQHDLVEF